jgi:glyoxylase-like metal-dependent hydrolase (beta-lactamase superfamily II)
MVAVAVGPAAAAVVTPAERRTSVGVEVGTEGTPVLVRWSTWAPRFGSQERVAYALRTAAGPVLVDPEAPAAGQAGRVGRLVGRPPVATLLTSDRHERDAYAIRARWGTPVWAPAAGLPERGGELAGRPDHAFEDGELLPGGVLALRVPGGWTGAEAALLWAAPGGARVLFTGDLLNGPCAPDQPTPYRGRRAPGLYAGVRWSHLARLPDVARLRAGLRRLLAEDFDLVCGAHGLPFGAPAGAAPRPGPDPVARAALVRLLELDWVAAVGAGRLPAVPGAPAGAAAPLGGWAAGAGEVARRTPRTAGRPWGLGGVWRAWRPGRRPGSYRR